MSNSEDSSQDSLLESLLNLIPGYGGYRQAEQRREDDRRARQFLVQRLGEAKAKLERSAAEAAARGDLQLPMQLEELRRQLDLAQNRLSAALEGYAGWFSTRQVDAELLDKLTRLDQNLVSLVDQIDSLLSEAQVSGGAPKQPDMDQAVGLLQQRIDRRNEILSTA